MVPTEVVMTETIRPYRAQDLAAGRRLWRELTQRHREIYDDPSIGGDDPGAGLDEYLANPKLAGPWVTVREGEVVALGGLLIEGPQAEIEPVIVAPEHRSRGVGTRLIHFLVAEARTREVAVLSIRPVARNREAIACFYRAGFTLLGHLDMFLDLKSTGGRGWKRAIRIHDHEFGY
jgi:GNAT superfamily N-acetyltransferase